MRAAPVLVLVLALVLVHVLVLVVVIFPVIVGAGVGAGVRIGVGGQASNGAWASIFKFLAINISVIFIPSGCPTSSSLLQFDRQRARRLRTNR